MPWEKATMPDRTTSAGNGVDMLTDSPESSILSEVALFRGLPAEQLSKIGARLGFLGVVILLQHIRQKRHGQ
jgi:hypothetical protein